MFCRNQDFFFLAALPEDRHFTFANYKQEVLSAFQVSASFGSFFFLSKGA